MIRRASLLFMTLAAALVLALPALPRSAAAEGPVLSYNVDLVSNYVWRGIEIFSAANTDNSAFNMAPAVQPSLTFYGPGGLSFGLWGSYAVSDRDPADFNLQAADEMDYTLAYAWSNRMGAFSAGLVSYTLTSVQSGNGAANEMFVTWGLPVMPSIAPTVAHYADIGSGLTYTSLGIGGGESLSWAASVGFTRGIQDVTASVGYGFGDLSVKLSLAMRPDETLVGYAEGADYPSTVAWLTFSYGREVTE